MFDILSLAQSSKGNAVFHRATVTGQCRLETQNQGKLKISLNIKAAVTDYVQNQRHSFKTDFLSLLIQFSIPC